MPASTGPSILLFKRFQASWENIDQTNYEVGIKDKRILSMLQNQLEGISLFIKNLQKSTMQPRDDYRELLLLCLIFIDQVPREAVKFYKPGAFSRARWMAKAIYCLKIFLFREEFHLTASETKSLAEICTFIVAIYVEAWFTAPLANAAPNHDLNFLKKLYHYRNINPIVSKVATKKMSNHLWYLNTENAAMAFFDETVSAEVKRKMVENIKSLRVRIKQKITSGILYRKWILLFCSMKTSISS